MEPLKHSIESRIFKLTTNRDKTELCKVTIDKTNVPNDFTRAWDMVVIYEVVSYVLSKSRGPHSNYVPNTSDGKSMSIDYLGYLFRVRQYEWSLSKRLSSALGKIRSKQYRVVISPSDQVAFEFTVTGSLWPTNGVLPRDNMHKTGRTLNGNRCKETVGDKPFTGSTIDLNPLKISSGGCEVSLPSSSSSSFGSHSNTPLSSRPASSAFSQNSVFNYLNPNVEYNVRCRLHAIGEVRRIRNGWEANEWVARVSAESLGIKPDSIMNSMIDFVYPKDAPTVDIWLGPERPEINDYHVAVPHLKCLRVRLSHGGYWKLVALSRVFPSLNRDDSFRMVEPDAHLSDIPVPSDFAERDRTRFVVGRLKRRIRIPSRCEERIVFPFRVQITDTVTHRTLDAILTDTTGPAFSTYVEGFLGGSVQSLQLVFGADDFSGRTVFEIDEETRIVVSIARHRLSRRFSAIDSEA